MVGTLADIEIKSCDRRYTTQLEREMQSHAGSETCTRGRFSCPFGIVALRVCLYCMGTSTQLPGSMLWCWRPSR